MPADHACFPTDASLYACYPRSERTRHSRLSKTQQRSVLIKNTELSSEPPILALAHSSLLFRVIMGKLNLPTVSVVCDEKVAHLNTTNYIPPKTPRNARARSPTYHEPPERASAPMSHAKPRVFAFLKKRANTMHSHPVAGDKQARLHPILARTNTHPPPSPRQTRDQPSTHSNFALRASRDASQTTEMHNKPQSTQDRSPSVLVRLYSSKGDAPASPPYERNTKDDSPIDTAVRQIQEAGFSARAKALQTAGSLLDHIGKQQVDKKAVCNVVFINLIDMFERFPLDNVEEIAREFQLFSILVHEEVVEGSEFIRAAKFLRDEGCHDGCKLLLRLIFDDRRIKLTDVESAGLADVASDMNLEHGMQQAISVV
ncbi:hypothetical protein ACEPAF_9195 [Sanghuangporus sanghuang]